ncbi:flagellar basal-body MS-ring/collar protein FliF [Nocardioides marmoribigeumensis]|uniref:Flagellar M-ring protein n=1 Tax=Nocardioides marmoribigeumensis TaxID=433649 RepID=A0ABU2BWF0_9ACTN|nr:flagellar basal-body MS-ring/collar protein FliF [Nocardioides marmoribigeumensis]MDR7362068.1 flagellar M-ring protein FliF [Nocardioides marmoribigeumensis]
MRDNLTRSLKGFQSTFGGFTTGQKVVAIVGTGALLLAGFMVFRWASTPAYAPLYSNLAASDASAVIQELDSQGIGYKLSNGGNTIMVPADQVYSTRISMSGQGLPTSSEGGYSILDKQGLSTSQFQERTDFKRAMEGELSKTIEAIDGVDAAVVHLAMPEKNVFTENQDPTTASVLVKTRAGLTLSPEQVQAIVNLVSSSVDGLDTDKVTVADATGKVLSAPGAVGTGGYTQNQNQMVVDYQNRLSSQLQGVLDKVLGPGNSANQITAQLSFDKTVTETTDYADNKGLALSESEDVQKLRNGAVGATAGANGVVGPTSQTETGSGNGGSKFDETNRTTDFALDKSVETREAAPGKLEKLGVGVVLDTRALAGRDPAEIEALVTSALGLDTKRGDTITVSSLPFDRTATDAAAKELADSQKAEAKAQRMDLIRNGGLIGLVALMVLAGWVQSRKRAKARAQATEYVVEQLRRDAQDRQALAGAAAAVEAPNPAMLALESAQADETASMRDEIALLVERQPEDVAQLLRGWLVERGV